MALDSVSETSRRTVRRRKLRVTTGCLTCRQRHVKCDERRPNCANCAKKNRTCRYEGEPEQEVNEREEEALGSTTSQPHPSATSRLALSNELQRRSTQEQESSVLPAQTESNPVLSQLIAHGPTSDNQDDGGHVISTLHNSQELDILSPFSATLGSILLDAEYYPQDTNGGDGGSDLLQQLHTASASHLNQQPPQETGELQLPPLELCVDYQIQLSASEVPIFRNYVDNISHWVDSFSYDRPFHRLVPILALRCAPLLHSCLALASKQMDLTGILIPFAVTRSESMRYYRLALSAIQNLLLHPEYAQSDEVLASCILLSTYEMIDVVGESLGSHLTGVASLLQARQVYGNVSGIRGACYWTWYRHEVWAALRTGRQMSLDKSYWEPEPLPSFDHLKPEEIANRVIFIFGQCINFCNDDAAVTTSASNTSLAKAREATASSLDRALDDWKSKLSSSMSFIPVEEHGEVSTLSDSLEAMWFIFPHSAVANQVYHASKIILALNRRQEVAPLPRGLANSSFLTTQRRIESHRRQIFLTANARIPDAWSLVSTQCLYIAGLVTEGVQERQRTLDLIEQCQRSSGRKTGVLSSDLRNLWASRMEGF